MKLKVISVGKWSVSKYFNKTPELIHFTVEIALDKKNGWIMVAVEGGGAIESL